MPLQFGVLGPLRVEIDGIPQTLPRSPVLRALLAALLLAEGQRLSAARLRELVWSGQAEEIGPGAVQTAVSRLRSWLAKHDDPAVAVDHDGAGYRLRVPAGAVDLARFRTAVESGAVADALMLRRGPVLADVARLDHSDALLLAVEQDVRAAALAWADAALAGGDVEAGLPAFESLAQTRPLDEPLQAARMRLLAAGGRPAEALRLFQGLRHQLVEELGVEPGPLVQDAFAAILAEDREPESDPLRPLPVPAQLPPTVAGFVGRRGSAARIREALRAGRLPVVAGLGGIGKTTLAVHVAAQLTAEYPDGQLYTDLRGAEDDPADPHAVLGAFLRALGLDPRQIPDDQPGRTALYRSVLADRRVLVVLDNAADEQQVRPLLPGAATAPAAIASTGIASTGIASTGIAPTGIAPTGIAAPGPSAAVVTSRTALTALDASTLIDLSVLSHPAAHALLAHLIGPDRLAAEPAEAAEILESCDHIPLAVRIVGARLAGRPRWSLARLAAMLRDERDRLDLLSVGDLAIRASLGLSVDRLPAPTRRVFRLLGLLDVPDFPAWTAAAVADCTPAEADQHVERLVDAHLLEVAGTEPFLRYRFHDLVRIYARELSIREDPPSARQDALTRALGGWLWLAERAADRAPGPCFAAIHGDAPRWPHPQDAAALPADTLTWFDAEHETLSAATRQALALGLVSTAWELAAALEKYCDVRRLYDDWHLRNTTVREACLTTGDHLGAAVLTRGLIELTTWTIPDTDAQTMVATQERATALLHSFEAIGEDRGAADALILSAWGLAAQGRAEEALTAAQDALARSIATSHLGGQARAHQIIAVVHSDTDAPDLSATIDHLTQALALARRLGNARFEATAMQFLGAAHCQAGEGDQGRTLLLTSLAMARAFDDSYTEAFSLLYLAKYYVLSGDPAAARAAAESAVTISRRHTMGHHLADALRVVGELDLAEGNVDAAVAALEESVALWRARGWSSFTAEAEDALSRARERAAAVR